MFLDLCFSAGAVAYYSAGRGRYVSLPNTNGLENPILL